MACGTCTTPDLCWEVSCNAGGADHPRRWHTAAIVLGAVVLAVCGLAASSIIMMEVMERLAVALSNAAQR